MNQVVGVALAAGAGLRLRPLTALRPKALCPVGGVPLLDRTLAPLERLVGRGPQHVAVNAHHLSEQIAAHLATSRAPAGEGATASGVARDGAAGARAHLSVEQPEPLGTAGALGALRDWLDGRHVVVLNADVYVHGPDATDTGPDGTGGTGGTGGRVSGDPRLELLDGWDGERCRLLCRPALPGQRVDFVGLDGTGLRFVGASVLPWRLVARLDAVPSGLYETLWASRLDQLDLVSTDAIVIDCGTAADYLQANLLACHGCSSIGAGAVVEGRLTRSVVWDGAYVGPQESLVDAVRAGTRAHPVTVTVHPPRLPLAPPSQHRDHERR